MRAADVCSACSFAGLLDEFASAGVIDAGTRRAFGVQFDVDAVWAVRSLADRADRHGRPDLGMRARRLDGHLERLHQEFADTIIPGGL